VSAASLVVKITADMTGFSKSVKQMTQGIRDAAKEVATIAAALSPIAIAAVELSKMGMEAEEVGRRFHETFGPGAAEMHEAIEKLRAVVPETTTELERMAAQVNEFARGVDIAAPQAATLTRGLLDMAAKISTAKSIPMNDVLQGLERGLMGSTKAFREFGIDIKQTAIEHEALRLGLIKSKDELDASRTAIAAYSLLLGPVAQLTSSAAKAQGGAAQQWRLMKSDVSELAEELGTHLLPIIHAVIGELRQLIDAFANPSWTKVLAGIAASFALVKGDVSEAVRIWDEATMKFVNPTIPTPPSATELTGGTPPKQVTLESLKADAQMAVQAFTQMRDANGDMSKVTTHILDLNKQVLNIYKSQHGEITQMGLEAQKIAHELALIFSVGNVVSANRTASLRTELSPQQKREFVQTSVSAASHVQASDLVVFWNAALGQVAAETQLRFREISIRLVNMFNAPREAAVEFAEKIRASSNTFSKTLETLKIQWANPGASFKAGASDALDGFMLSLGPVALAFKAIGYVLQGLQPVIDALGQPLIALGQILGEMLIPLLRPLFDQLKLVGIAAAFVGQILYRVAQGLANVVGGVIITIGKLIAKIPFMGGVGRGIEKVGQGFLDLANSFGKTAKDLGIEAAELEKMKFGEAAAGILGLGEAAAYAANQLTNVPSGYRVALAVFNAMAVRSGTTSPTMPYPGGGAGGASGAQSYTFAPGAIVISGANKTGDQLLTEVVAAARQKSKALFGTTARAAEAFA
jgi:hypothetical protein